jgi:SdpC family antimicrobial peptide
MRKMRKRFGTTPWLAAACMLLLAVMIIHTGGPQAYAARPAHTFTGEQLYRGLILGHGQVADLIPQVRDHYRLSNFVTTVPELQLAETVHDRIISSISAADPGFFQRFGTLIRSGDHIRISQAFQHAQGVTLKAIGAIPEVQELRARYNEDPSLREVMLDDLRNLDSQARLTEIQLQDAADAVLVATLPVGDVGAPVRDEVASITIVAAAAIIAVAAIVITVVVASAYATAINVAGAINFALAIFATVTAGLTAPGDTSLLMEELVHSVAVNLAGPGSRLSPARDAQPVN